MGILTIQSKCFTSCRMLLAFMMIPLLQKELDIFKESVWNTHRIRAQKDRNLPAGVPNHIYNFPELYGLEDKGSIFEKIFEIVSLNTAFSFLTYINPLLCNLLLC